MAVDDFDNRCVSCRRKVPYGDKYNHHCTPCDLVSVDEEGDSDGTEERWEEPDEPERLNYGFELLAAENVLT